MSPDRVALLVLRWVRLYTAGTPTHVAHRRIEEIHADLHDQTAAERALGLSDRRIASRILWRAARGAAADLTWRAHAVRAVRTPTTEEHTMHTAGLTRSAVRVSGFVLAFLAVPLVGTAVSDEFGWSVADFVLAAALLGVIGSCLDAALRRRGSPWIAGGVAALGVAAGVIGQMDDAPGLVLIGTMMIAGGALMARRRTPTTP